MDSMEEKLGGAVVGVAGLGGLGSTVAVALARAGVGKLVVVDFDDVDESNLDRQYYFVDQIGQGKVEAMKDNLGRINPEVEVEGHRQKLDGDNILEIFDGADVVAECFDKAEEKQMIVEAVLSKMEAVPIVSVSGLAGYGNSNTIQTRRISERLILVGDGESSIDSGMGLCGARVGIAACHQANAIIELIVDGVEGWKR